ncbi:MAG: UbiA family prenyltransferase, partial [Thermodesulfobacteriota bacterium]
MDSLPSRGRLHAWLQLLRLANTPTAVADVLAGALVAAGFQVDPGRLLAAGLASVAFYSGGCVLNDLVDQGEDAQLRPERPLPSGRVRSSQARLAAGALLGLGLAACALAGLTSLAAGLALAGLIVLYDLGVKDHPLLGPAAMASCRAMNAVLGLSLGWPTGVAWLLPLLLGWHVAALTVLSRHEIGGAAGRLPAAVGTVWLGLIALLAGLAAAGLLAA